MTMRLPTTVNAVPAANRGHDPATRTARACMGASCAANQKSPASSVTR